MPTLTTREVLAIRAKFEELYSKFKTETDAAAEKGSCGRRSVYPRHRAP